LNVKKIASGIKLLALDFDGVFTDNRVLVTEKGEEAVFCNRTDGFGINHIARPARIETVVISLEKNPVVSKRCEKLGIEYYVGITDKLSILNEICVKRNIGLDEVCFIGNDITDIECIKAAGLGVCVADSFPEVIKIADVVTKKAGGDGAIREVCELLTSSK